jgi:hypothetical protein
METTAATAAATTATARGGDDGGGDDNDDNGTIAMVINLVLRTVGVRRYITRLNLTGGMAVSLFFQGGDGGEGGGGGGEEVGKEKTRTNEDDTAPPHSMGTARELVDMLRGMPRELLALGDPRHGSAVVEGGQRRRR